MCIRDSYEHAVATEDDPTARTLARPAYEESLAMFESLAEASPANGRAQRDWAWARYYLAYLEADGGDEARGRSELIAGAHLLMNHLARNPNDSDARKDVALYLQQVVDLEPYLGGPPMARDTLQMASDSIATLRQQRPKDRNLEQLANRVQQMQYAAHHSTPDDTMSE